MARPYPVVFRQCASVSARSRTTDATSANFGSATGTLISLNPGSPSCNKVRTLISLYFHRSTESRLGRRGIYPETPLRPRHRQPPPVPKIGHDAGAPTASLQGSRCPQPRRHHRRRSPNHPVPPAPEPARQSHPQLYPPFPCTARFPLEAKAPWMERRPRTLPQRALTASALSSIRRLPPPTPHSPDEIPPPPPD